MKNPVLGTLIVTILLAACAPTQDAQLAENELKNSSGIVGGQDIPATDLGALSTVQIIDGFNRRCSGTLIAPDIVLTAAHCVKDAGDLDIVFAAAPEITVPSKALKAHESYATLSEGVLKLKNEHRNDIGLILLSANAPKQAVIAELPDSLYPAGVLTVQAAGYGRTGSENDDAGILRKVDLQAVIRNEDEKHFFIDQTIGKGFCQGDSGGPLYVFKKQKPVVVGVVNGSDDVDAFFGEPVGDQCRYTGVATQVAAYKTWIQENIRALRAAFASQKTSAFESDVNTDQAICRKPFPTLHEMKAELQAMTAKDASGNTGVGGLALKNENPRLINAYRYLVSYKTYQFKIQNDIDNWLLFKDHKECDKALCAAEIVFGPEEGVLYLYVAAKYGLVLSSLGFDKLKPPTEKDTQEFNAYFSVRAWKKGELVPYLKALPMLPKIGVPMPFTRMNHAGITNPVNPNVLSNGIISFYNPMDAMSDSHKEQTTFHEIAHNFGTYYGLDSSKEWLEVTGWQQEGKSFVNKRPGEFITRYAATNFFEDFAESFTYYRYYPAKLKTKSPRRYEFLKNKVFQGQEYLDEKACR